jgi:hypothetical protein
MRVVLARIRLRTLVGKIVVALTEAIFCDTKILKANPFGATFLPNSCLNKTAENPATSKNIQCSRNKDLPPNRSRNIISYMITCCHREKLPVDVEVIT